MKNDPERIFGPNEKIWTGNLSKPRKLGIFKSLTVGYDKYNRLQATFQRLDGNSETYNPWLTPIEVEHRVIVSSTDPNESSVPSYNPKEWPNSYLATTHISSS